MREIMIPMPRIERRLCRCTFCGDELTPRLDVYMLGRYDPKKDFFSAEYAHPQCAERQGIVRDGHVIPGEKVLAFWKMLARRKNGMETAR